MGKISFFLTNSLFREIERLETELDKVKADYNSQLRQLRSQLATTAMEKQHQDSSCGQLEALLADSRRENKLLKVSQRCNH